MTNGDKIRAMSDDDLAEFLTDNVGECENCPAYRCEIESGGCSLPTDMKMWETCNVAITHWLEAEA